MESVGFVTGFPEASVRRPWKLMVDGGGDGAAERERVRRSMRATRAVMRLAFMAGSEARKDRIHENAYYMGMVPSRPIGINPYIINFETRMFF
jgi:hypothetical protein